MSDGLLNRCGMRLLRISIFLMLAVSLGACRSDLFSRLDEGDANAVLSALYAEGIEAVKLPAEGSTWRIEVAESDHQRALHVAGRHGVPRQRFSSMGDLFKKEGLVSSPSEERLRFIFAVSQELANTLSQIDGVVSARVHPVIPHNDPLADKVKPASAAVFIKHRSDADLQQMAPAIKTLVARSIEGLSVDNVSLTFLAVRSWQEPASRPEAAQSSAVAALAAVTALAASLLLGALGLRWWRGHRGAAQREAQLVKTTESHG